MLKHRSNFEESFTKTSMLISSTSSECMEDFISISYIDKSHLHSARSCGISFFSLPSSATFTSAEVAENAVPLNSHARRDVFLGRGESGEEKKGKESCDAAGKQNGETA